MQRGRGLVDQRKYQWGRLASFRVKLADLPAARRTRAARPGVDFMMCGLCALLSGVVFLAAANLRSRVFFALYPVPSNVSSVISTKRTSTLR